MNNNIPNIFDYATSELSQDAFLLWLLNHAKNKAEPDIAEIGNEFLLFLIKLYQQKFSLKILENNKGSLQIKVIEKQKKVQFKGVNKFIDVFCACEMNGNKFAIIIEDKTNSKPHSGQLKAYSQEVANTENYQDHQLINIYYKTGYVFEDEIESCKNAEYAILGILELSEFLKKFKTDNLIFNDYTSYILKKQQQRSSHLRSLALTESAVCEKHLTVGYVQYEFLKLLRDKSELKSKDYFLTNGSSSGKPYSQLRLSTIKRKYDDTVNEHIFYRIERMSKGVAISLRQYANVKNLSSKVKEDKVNALKMLIELSNQAQENITATKPQFAKIQRDRKGANSSQILLIYFNQNNEMKLKIFMEWLILFTKEFIRLLENEY